MQTRHVPALSDDTTHARSGHSPCEISVYLLKGTVIVFKSVIKAPSRFESDFLSIKA